MTGQISLNANLETISKNMLVDSLWCTDNKYMHESCRL